MATIKIRDENGNVICTTIIPASGNWSCTTSNLPDGPHTLTATQTDPAGNESLASVTLNIRTTDDDGVAVPVEQAAPNNGDANGDGIKDYLQSNAASLPDAVTAKYVVVATDPTSLCQTYNNVTVNSEPQNTVQDGGYDYPVGFVNFTAPCASSVKVKMYWYGLDTTKTYINRKYNKTTNTYSTVTGITSAIETVNGIPVLTYSYTVSDNDGILDEDPIAGTIKDPIGPAVVAQTNTNGGGTIIIANPTSSSSSSTSSTTSSVTSNSNPSNKTPSNSNPVSNILPAIQSNIEGAAGQINDQIKNASGFVADTIRTGGNSQTIAYSTIILGLMILISFIAYRSKENE
jgi:hypothetical protein